MEIVVAHHDATVALKARRWEALSQGIGHHKICARRHQVNQISQAHFVNVVSVNVDMMRIFSANGVDSIAIHARLSL